MKAKQLYFLLIALMIVAIGAIIGTFVWGKGQLETSALNLSNLIAERDAQRENIIFLQQAEVQSEEITQVNQLLDRLLPTEKNQETLVLDVIYTASAEAGIPTSSIVTFSFSGADDPDELSGTRPYKEVAGVLEYPFNLELQNISYEALLKLLSEIENNGRIVQIDTVQISPSKTDAGFLSSVSLTMKAYVKQ
jgi:Tfp pilus assembly protein PilO